MSKEKIEDRMNRLQNEYDSFKNNILLTVRENLQELQEGIKTFVKEINEIKQVKSNKINFENDVITGINNSIKQAVFETLSKSYDNPLSKYINELIMEEKDNFSIIFKEILKDCFNEKEFKQELKNQTMKKIAQVLVSQCQSIVEKDIVKLKQDEIFKARMMLLIEQSLKEVN